MVKIELIWHKPEQYLPGSEVKSILVCLETGDLLFYKEKFPILEGRWLSPNNEETFVKFWAEIVSPVSAIKHME